MEKCERPEVSISSDYAVLSFDGGMFYYGYEETENEEWCFVLKVDNKEGEKTIVKIPFSKLKAGDQWDCESCLLVGIGWVLTRYPLVLDANKTPGPLA